MIVKALKSGRTLTWLDAVKEFGCSKLSTRICEIEKAGIIQIDRGWKTLENGKTVRTYWLKRQKRTKK
jgi:hypothetical protein